MNEWIRSEDDECVLCDNRWRKVLNCEKQRQTIKSTVLQQNPHISQFIYQCIYFMEHLPLKQGNDNINTWSIIHFHVKLIDLCSSSLILIVSTLIRSIHSYSSIIINNIHIFLPATCLYSLHEYKQNTFQKACIHT